MPVIAIGLQFVGLNWNGALPGRSTVTTICLSAEGMPLMYCGKGSLVTVTAAVFSSTLIVEPTTM